MGVIERRLHWHEPDEQPPERVTFWRGGIRPDRPRWEQQYVRADAYQGAVLDAEKLAAYARFTLAQQPHGDLPSPDEVQSIIDRYPTGGR